MRSITHNIIVVMTLFYQRVFSIFRISSYKWFRKFWLKVVTFEVYVWLKFFFGNLCLFLLWLLPIMTQSIFHLHTRKVLRMSTAWLDKFLWDCIDLRFAFQFLRFDLFSLLNLLSQLFLDSFIFSVQAMTHQRAISLLGWHRPIKLIPRNYSLLSLLVIKHWFKKRYVSFCILHLPLLKNFSPLKFIFVNCLVVIRFTYLFRIQIMLSTFPGLSISLNLIGTFWIFKETGRFLSTFETKGTSPFRSRTPLRKLRSVLIWPLRSHLFMIFLTFGGFCHQIVHFLLSFDVDLA